MNKKSSVSKILSWLVGVPLAFAVIGFCILNREAVTVDFWIFMETQQVPLYLLILLCLATGIVWGGSAAWWAAGGARRKAREATRRAETAEAAVADLRERNAELQREEAETRRRSSSVPAMPLPTNAPVSKLGAGKVDAA